MRSMQPERLAAHRLGHADLAAAVAQAVEHACSRSSPSTGSARSSCRWRFAPAVGRFDQRLAGRELAHAVQDAVVGGDDVGGAVPSTTAFSSCVVEPTTSACATTLAGDSGCTSTAPAGVRALQLQLQALELVVHDAGAVPQQHVGAGLLLDVAAQMAVRRPQDLLPALVQVRTIATAHELVTIQSARAFTAALVLA
jgi:hypothetical protein